MPANKSHWLRRANMTAWKFNAGWFLQRFLPIGLLVGILLSVIVLALRSAKADLTIAIWAAVVGVLSALLAAYLLARRNFLSQSGALSRLDEDLHLHNRLSAAAVGVGNWPEPKPVGETTLRWKWLSLVWPLAAVGLLLLAAFWIPIPGEKNTTSPVSEPSSWTSAGDRIETLKREDLVESKSIEELQKALDALRAQPEDQWFNHQSLEAGDHLNDITEQGMRSLQKELEGGLAAMELARQLESSQLKALADPLNQKLQEAFKAMEMGALPLNKEMLDKLKNLDPSKIAQLSEKEWKELSERMKKGIGNQPGKSGEGEGKSDELMALILSQQSGGVSRGPGTAPMALKDEKTKLGTGKNEKMENDDLSHAAIGDLQGVSKTEHEVDKEQWQGLQQAGGIANTGSGGDAVWQQETTPEEQAVLKRFFK